MAESLGALPPQPGPPVPRLLARGLAWAYGRVVARRNRAFDRSKRVVEFDRPTISVGNLSVGGTGKTPMVMHALGVLKGAGFTPCVAMRGYGAAGGESDEAAEYSRAFPETPVVARANRVEGLISLFGTPEGERVDAIVLDDGFQHRRIARDLDLVLIDLTRSPFDDALLPLGWLREPVESLARAGAIVLTHAESAPGAVAAEIERAARAVNPGATIAVCEHAWTELRVVENGRERTEPVGWLRSRRVVAACAIGNPGPFLAGVSTAAGRAPEASIVLRDHDPYRERTIDRIIEQARKSAAAAVVVTDKDWSKLRRTSPERWPCSVVRPALGLRFVRGGEGVRELIVARCRARPHVPVEELLGVEPPVSAS